MLTFKQHLKKHSLPIAAKKSKKTQHEGIQLSPSDFIVDPTAMDADSSYANEIDENDDVVTLPLQGKK